MKCVRKDWFIVYIGVMPRESAIAHRKDDPRLGVKPFPFPILSIERYMCYEEGHRVSREVCIPHSSHIHSPKRMNIWKEINMNRENKRKQYEKNYYKHNPCNESFTCKSCGRLCVPEGAGSQHRNHCPNCLTSLHLDTEPGDREADCGGQMEPIAVWVRKHGEWAIVHRCRLCGWISSNRVAADDNPMKLMSIAMKPLTNPPFPLERIEEMTALMGGAGSIR